MNFNQLINNQNININSKKKCDKNIIKISNKPLSSFIYNISYKYYNNSNNIISNIDDFIKITRNILYNSSKFLIPTYDFNINQKYQLYRNINILNICDLDSFKEIVEYIISLNLQMTDDEFNIIKYCIINYGFYPSFTIINLYNKLKQIINIEPSNIPDYIIYMECSEQSGFNIFHCSCINLNLIISYALFNQIIPSYENYLNYLNRALSIFELNEGKSIPTENLNNIKSIRFNKKLNKDNCPLCLEEIKSNEKIVKMECCKKLFHNNKKCTIIKWLQNNNKCPTCNQVIIIS